MSTQTNIIYQDPGAPVKAKLNRKRKSCDSDDNEFEKFHSLHPMVWDSEEFCSSDMLDSMGVEMICDKAQISVDEKHDNCIVSKIKSTPVQSAVAQELVPPGAPKVSSVNLANQFSSLPVCHDESIGILNPSIISKKPFTYTKESPKSCFSNREAHWGQLSDEIMIHIFRLLPKQVIIRCSRVCRRWFRLSMDESLWRRLDMANKVLKAGVFGNIIDRGCAVLRLAKSEIKSPLHITNLNSSLPASPKYSRVQFLDLSMAVITPETLKEVISLCRFLRKLSLENCEVNDNICSLIANNTYLEVLNLSMCRGISENGLVPICNNLKRLNSLNIAWTGLSRGAVVYLIVSISSSLQRLNISGCRDSLLDEDVLQLVTNCANLRELDLSDATQLTSDCIQHIVHNLSTLEYLALSRCYHIRPSTIPYLCNIPSLLAVDFFGMFKDATVLKLQENMPNIEINKFPFSSIARPTTGIRRTSIWGLRVRDNLS